MSHCCSMWHQYFWTSTHALEMKETLLNEKLLKYSTIHSPVRSFVIKIHYYEPLQYVAPLHHHPPLHTHTCIRTQSPSPTSFTAPLTARTLCSSIESVVFCVPPRSQDYFLALWVWGTVPSLTVMYSGPPRRPPWTWLPSSSFPPGTSLMLWELRPVDYLPTHPFIMCFLPCWFHLPAFIMG